MHFSPCYCDVYIETARSDKARKITAKQLKKRGEILNAILEQPNSEEPQDAHDQQDKN